MLGEVIPQLIRGKYFREILARDVRGFYFRRGGGVRMERYIHTIHAPADISQGGGSRSVLVLHKGNSQSISSASMISSTSVVIISHWIGVADMSLSIVLASICSLSADCTDFNASK